MASLNQTSYGLRVVVLADFDAVVVKATEALKAEGFGVLTTIDVRDTLKKKLDVEFRRYVILGACNPSLAARALDAELEVGLLLPCNVVVYEDGQNRSVVAAMAPITALGLVPSNDALASVAREADQRLRRALAAVSVG